MAARIRPWFVLLPIAVFFVHLGALTLVLGAWRVVIERTIQARNRADTNCASYRHDPRHSAASVCSEDRFRASETRRLGEVKRLAQRARSAFAVGEVGRGKEVLAQALTIAGDTDGHGSFIAGAVAAAETRQVLDVIDDAGPLLTPSDRIDLLDAIDLTTARAPFEGERVHRAWMLSRGSEGLPYVVQAIAADRSAQADVVLATMERSIVRGDVAACERTAADYPTMFVGDTTPRAWCKTALDVVRTGQRLDAARAAFEPRARPIPGAVGIAPGRKAG